MLTLFENIMLKYIFKKRQRETCGGASPTTGMTVRISTSVRQSIAPSIANCVAHLPEEI
jgi:hypothetical protein